MFFFYIMTILIHIVVALTRCEGHFVRYGASPRAAIQSGGKISAGCCVFGCRKWLITTCNNNMIHVITTACTGKTENTIFLSPFTLNGIWLWWQYSFRFRVKWNSIWLKIKSKTVTTIISHSMWKELEVKFSQWYRQPGKTTKIRQPDRLTTL